MDRELELSTDDVWKTLFEGLYGDGRLLLGDVSAYATPPPSSLLRQLWDESGVNYPDGNQPELDMETLGWAAQVVGVASHLVVNRYEDSGVLQKLVKSAPEFTESSLFCADILLQVLPDIWTLAVRRSEGDSLVLVLASIAEAWPYSCIGMKIESPDQASLEVICSHRPLLVLFVERVMDRQDYTWLRYQPIREMVMEMIGDMWIDNSALIKELDTYGS